MNALPLTWCPICGSPAEEGQSRATGTFYRCIRCTTFTISGRARVALGSDEIVTEQRLRLSSHLAEAGESQLDADTLVNFLRIPEPNVPIRGEKLFQFLAKKLRYPGAKLQISFADARELLTRLAQKDNAILERGSSIHEVAKTVLPLMAASWSARADELHYLLSDYLCTTKLLVNRTNIDFRISGAGWEYLTTTNPEASNAGFVAMSFAAELDGFYLDGIGPAIAAAGYQPVRIDKHEHIDRKSVV